MVTAEAFLADATPIKSDFIRHAMPANFLEELSELISEFREAIDKKQIGHGTRLTARVAIDHTLEEGITAVRKLNAIVLNTFADDPKRLALWAAARHVQRPGRAEAPSVAPPLGIQPSTPPPAS